MSTPLMWKSFQLNSSIYNRILYPHILNPDPTKEQTTVETRSEKLVRFHVSSCVLSVELLCVFHFLGRSIFDPKFEFVYLTPFYVGLGVFIIMHLVLTKLLQTQGNQLLECFNQTIILEREMNGRSMQPIGHATQVGHCQLVSQEIRKYFNGDKTVDFMGLLMYSLAVILTLIGLLWAPFGCYYNFDPGYFFFGYIFHPMENQSRIIQNTAFIIRYLATHWSVLEATRSYSLILISLMAHPNALTNIVRSISQINISEITFKAYIQLQYLTQIGHEPIRFEAGVLMSSGFILAVVGNWLSIFGWEFIRFEVNLSMCLITLVVYFVIHETLPIFIRCHEDSKTMIASWNYKFMLGRKRLLWKNAKSGVMSVKLWRRFCRAQKPVTIFWCTTKFEKDTKINFYSNIVYYTVNMLLGFKATKRGG